MVALRQIATAAPEMRSTLPALDTSFTTIVDPTNPASYPIDVLTPLPISARRWWNPYPLFVGRSDLRRRHTVTPRIHPRSQRRRSSLRSIFSWRSGSSQATIQPERQYHQSRFIEGLKRSEWGFKDEEDYLFAPLPADQTEQVGSQERLLSTAESYTSDEEKEDPTELSKMPLRRSQNQDYSKRESWPLSRAVMAALAVNSSSSADSTPIDTSPVDSHHPKEELLPEDLGIIEEVAYDSSKTPTVTVSDSRHHCRHHSEPTLSASPRWSTTAVRHSEDSFDRPPRTKCATKIRRSSKLASWLAKKLRVSTKDEQSGSEKRRSFVWLKGGKL